MNKTAIRELADHMDQMPKKHFDMFSFATTTSRDETVTLRNHCGTTCCMAGEKVLLDGGSIQKGRCDELCFVIGGETVEPYDYATRKLGLDDRRAFDLFFDYSLETPQQAAQKLRGMIGE